MRVVDLIIKKKNKGELSKEEIHFLIKGYVEEIIPDYQMSALLMAINLNGLTKEEQVNFTLEMLYSGEVIDLSSLEGIKVDKHSTGGVGDKTTLVVAPIIASTGIIMAKMSGRGLGHTGGTLDKLEAIPNFRISLTDEEFLNELKEIHLAVVGQTLDIAPADKKLYSLRDVTGTVESIGLIAASIMSKKLASGADYILLDVKAGDGAFMKDLSSARSLARAMVDIGNAQNKKTVAMITDMDQPLGSAVGNSIEVIEAIETLKGRGPKDFRDLCVSLSTEILVLTGYAETKTEAEAVVLEKLANGEALEKLRQMIIYQGGDSNIIEDYNLLPKAKYSIEVKSAKSGYVKKINTLAIGNAAMLLGAGRLTKDDSIDLAVGVEVNKKVGMSVEAGEALAIVHANNKDYNEVIDLITNAFIITTDEVKENKLILDIVE